MTDQLPAHVQKDLPQELFEQLRSQNPLHGMFARVFEAVGGEEKLLELAEDDFQTFIKLLVKMTPQPQENRNQGGLHLHLHQDLQPGPLDQANTGGVTIDQDMGDESTG